MEMMKRSSGVAKAGLTTGIIGTSLGALNTLGLLGGGAALAGLGSKGTNTIVDVVPQMPMAGAFSCGYPWSFGTPFNNNCGCNEDHYVTRYDAEKDARIAKLEADIALRDANTYSDQKMLQLYQEFNRRSTEIEARLSEQAVINQANYGRFELMQQKQECCCKELEQAICNERERRECADQNIVNYMNATFVPQTIQEPAAGTTTYRQSIWNPLPGECGCKKSCPSK